MITDRAFDQLLAIYEQDRILWAAVYTHMEDETEGVEGIRVLARRHHIDPDA